MKTITALGVVRLVEDKLRKQDKYKDQDIYRIPIKELLPKNFPNPELFRDFTLHQLLTHTSGLTDQVMFEAYYGGKEVLFSDVKDFVMNASSLYQTQKLAGKGTHQYCNYGYFLLGLAIQAISGQSYYEYIRDQVLKPANMPHTQPLRSTAPTATPYISAASLAIDIMPKWLKEMTVDDSDHNLNQIALSTFKIFEKIQKFSADPAYEYVKNLHIEYQKRLASTDEKGYTQLRGEFAKKLDQAYSMICTQDSEGHFQFKYSELKQQMIEINQRLGEWMDKNRSTPELADKIKQAQELRGLLFNAYASLYWPLQVLAGIQVNLSIGHPAGCWFSTADDLLHLHQALWSKDGALSRYAPILESPKETKEFGYGYGLCIGERGDKGHSGSTAGVSTEASTNTNEGITLIVLGNDDSPEKINLQPDLQHFLIRCPLRVLDSTFTPEQTLLADIVAIHKDKNHGSKLQITI